MSIQEFLGDRHYPSISVLTCCQMVNDSLYSPEEEVMIVVCDAKQETFPYSDLELALSTPCEKLTYDEYIWNADTKLKEMTFVNEHVQSLKMVHGLDMDLGLVNKHFPNVRTISIPFLLNVQGLKGIEVIPNIKGRFSHEQYLLLCDIEFESLDIVVFANALLKDVCEEYKIPKAKRYRVVFDFLNLKETIQSEGGYANLTDIA
jgi:hypothetical protein